MPVQVNYSPNSLLDSDKKVLVIIVNSYGTAIPKVLRQDISILEGYKGILRKYHDKSALVGRCIPLFSTRSATERFYALLVINGTDGIENSTRTLLGFCHAIGEQSIAIRECDFELLKNNLDKFDEVDVMEHG